jgi:hypothetical protein
MYRIILLQRGEDTWYEVERRSIIGILYWHKEYWSRVRMHKDGIVEPARFDTLEEASAFAEYTRIRESKPVKTVIKQLA